MNPWALLGLIVLGAFVVFVYLPIVIVVFGRMVRFVWRGWEPKSDEYVEATYMEAEEFCSGDVGNTVGKLYRKVKP